MAGAGGGFSLQGCCVAAAPISPFRPVRFSGSWQLLVVAVELVLKGCRPWTSLT